MLFGRQILHIQVLVFLFLPLFWFVVFHEAISPSGLRVIESEGGFYLSTQRLFQTAHNRDPFIVVFFYCGMDVSALIFVPLGQIDILAIVYGSS